MPLPTIELPTYDLRLPSSGKQVTIRPFTVKEEKLLLIALESGAEQDIITTTKQVINNCIVSDPINLDSIPFFDVDYLFIALRAKSVGEAIDVKFRCENDVNGQTCGNIFPVKIDISNCKVKKNDEISPEIRLSNAIFVKMKYPSYAVIKSILDNDNILNKKTQMIIGSIDYIQEKERVFRSKDVPRNELVQFVESLTKDQYKKLENFVDNFPSFVVEAHAKCPKCGFDHYLEYKEFASFFV